MSAQKLVVLAGVVFLAAPEVGYPAGPPVRGRVDWYGDALPPGAVARLGTVRFRSTEEDPDFLLSPDGKTFALRADSVVLIGDLTTGKVLRPLRHEGQLSEDYHLDLLAFSPDGKRFATAAGKWRETVRVWDVDSGKQLWSHRGARAWSVAGVFSADSRTFVSYGRGPVVWVWESATGKVLRKLPLPGRHDDSAVSSNGKLLASLVDGHTIRLRDVWTGKEVRTLPRQESLIDTIRVSPDGRAVASVDEGRKRLRVWGVGSGKGVVIASREPIYPVSLCFSPDGKVLVGVAERDEALSAWEADTGRRLWTLRSERTRFSAFAPSPDGRTLAVREGQVIRLRDLRTGRQVRALAGRLARDDNWTQKLAFTEDGKVLVAKDGQALRLWSVRTGEEVRTRPGHTEWVAEFAFSADGRKVATRADGPVHVWQVRTGKHLQTFRGHEAGFTSCIALSADGRVGASCGWLLDSTVRVWDVASGRERYHFEQEPVPAGKGTYGVTILFSPDGKTLAVASRMSGQVDLRDPATGKRRRTITLPEGAALAHLGFSPDGRMLATAWGEFETKVERIRLWDVGTGSPAGLPDLPVSAPFVFSSDGGLLATHEEKVVRVWELLTGQAVHTFRPSHRVAGVAFTPSEAVLAVERVTGKDRDGGETFLDVWDVVAGKRIRRLPATEVGLLNVAFSPTGEWLAAAAWDTSVLVWDLRGSLAESDRARRKLTAGEPARLWEDLADRDAARAYRALWALRAAPREAVSLLEARLRPARPGGFARLIGDLGAAEFAVREAAFRELARQASEAEPELRAALREGPDLEVRRRIERLLAPLKRRPLPPEILRQIRAVRLLEQVASPAARRHLKALAWGAPGTWLTQEAKAALARLDALKAR